MNYLRDYLYNPYLAISKAPRKTSSGNHLIHRRLFGPIMDTLPW